MQCPSCGHENESTARFCLDCGQRLEITCPGCSKSLPPQARFCDANIFFGPRLGTVHALLQALRPRLALPRANDGVWRIPGSLTRLKQAVGM